MTKDPMSKGARDGRRRRRQSPGVRALVLRTAGTTLLSASAFLKSAPVIHYLQNPQNHDNSATAAPAHHSRKSVGRKHPQGAESADKSTQLRKSVTCGAVATGSHPAFRLTVAECGDFPAKLRRLMAGSGSIFLVFQKHGSVRISCAEPGPRPGGPAAPFGTTTPARTRAAPTASPRRVPSCRRSATAWLR
jgi:hypothetical protein